MPAPLRVCRPDIECERDDVQTPRGLPQVLGMPTSKWKTSEIAVLSNAGASRTLVTALIGSRLVTDDKAAQLYERVMKRVRNSGRYTICLPYGLCGLQAIVAEILSLLSGPRRGYTLKRTILCSSGI